MSSIIEQLKSEIQGFKSKIQEEKIGTIIAVKDGIANATGLADVASLEMVEFDNGVQGVALNLEQGQVGIMILGDYLGIHEGMKIKALGSTLSVPVGEEVVGRVLNALGQPKDGKPIDTKETNSMERIAPGVITRKSVHQPVQTGLKSIDAMVPIGRGQRELIIGDRQTGKSAVAIDTILNQKGQDMVCIYVAIGQKESKVAQIVARLEKAGAMDYTTVISASASEPAALNFLAPYAGCAMGEYFRDLGKDALIIYDDLSKHAVAYRQISLLLNRPPGREAYPGDVFYLHSRLLERAAKLNEDNGGGSLTALPIIETQGNDVTAYIPTNVISITDGQIYLESNLFNKGFRPAINVGLSVSRVGGAAQIKAMKKVAGSLRLDLAQFRELEAFTQFGSDLDADTLRQLERGKRLEKLLIQPQYQPMPVEKQVIQIYSATRGLMDDVNVDDISDFALGLVEYVEQNNSELLKEIAEKGEFDEKWEKGLKQSVEDYKSIANKEWFVDAIETDQRGT